MTQSPRRRIALSGTCALLLPALLLGGCVRFGGKPPASLLTVESMSRVAAGTVAQADAGVLTILEPDVPRALATNRVAVRADDASFAYVPKAVWVDTPRNLFRALLAETVAARNGTLVLDAGQFSADPGVRLGGDLVEFGIDARTKQAVVTYDASLMGKGGTLTRRRFTATTPVRNIDSDHAATAISRAANDVAVQVADWLKAGG